MAINLVNELNERETELRSVDDELTWLTSVTPAVAQVMGGPISNIKYDERLSELQSRSAELRIEIDDLKRRGMMPEPAFKGARGPKGPLTKREARVAPAAAETAVPGAPKDETEAAIAKITREPGRVRMEGGEPIPSGATPEAVARAFPGAFKFGPGGVPARTPEEAVAGMKRAIEAPPPGERPPKDFKRVQWENREGFEQEVFSQVGFNPLTFNPVSYMEQSMSELPALFGHVFGGRVAWVDRDKMDDDERKHWLSVLKMFRADKLREGEELQEVGIRQYNWMMNKFDASAKTFAESRKAPEAQEFWDPKAKAMRRYEFDPDTRQWTPTPHITKEPAEKKPAKVPPEVTNAWRMINDIFKQFGVPGDPEAPVDADSAAGKLRILMNTKPDMPPEIDAIYRNQLQKILDNFGIVAEGAGAETITVPTDITGKGTVKVYKGKGGKSYNVIIRKK